MLCLLSCKTEVKPDPFDAIKVSEYKDVTLSHGQLFRIDSFPTNYITPRPVDIWLPEGYSENKEYAVLYMHDGQMLFDATTTWNKQEWKVDEWASQLMRDAKTRDFIVVAVHNIPQIRWYDLYPQKAMDDYMDPVVRDSIKALAKQNNLSTTLKGNDYLSFLVKEVKPFVDSKYAVYTEKDNTFVAGSSMGGLMSMYAISEYPEVFGGAACISTHWPGFMPMPNNPHPEAIFKYMEANLPDANDHKLYFDYGTETLDAHYPQYAPKVDSILAARGYDASNSRNIKFEGTDHSENSWNQRLDIPFTFLLGNK